MNKKYSVVFAGTPSFACPALKALLKDERFDVRLVVSQPDKPVGRKQLVLPTPVKVVALENNIPVSQPEKITDIQKELEEISPDFFVVIAYGKILPESILEIPKFCINLHGSILPKYRGASPIQECLKHGDTVTGVSVMDMVKEMDAGGVYCVHEIKISAEDTAGTLFDKVADLGSDLPDDLVNIAEGLGAVPQNESKATYCKKIQKSDGEIIWKEELAEDIFNRMRAFTPWPGVFFMHNGKRVKVLSGSVSSSGFECKQGFFMPDRVIPEGKKEQSFVSWRVNNK